MKTSVIGLCVFGFATLSGAVQAQCGCRSIRHAPMTYSAPMSYAAPMSFAAPMVGSAPMTQSAPMAVGSISYVNKLDAPVDRGTYSLLYAVHLTNGRMLYTDGLPTGFSVRGTEAYRSGRRANLNVGPDGRLSINDPASNQVIAIIQQ